MNGTAETGEKTRVVILGAGFGGLELAAAKDSFGATRRARWFGQ